MNEIKKDGSGNNFIDIENIRLTYVSIKNRKDIPDYVKGDVIRFQVYKDEYKKSLLMGPEIPVSNPDIMTNFIECLSMLYNHRQKMKEEDILKAFDLFIEETIKKFVELGSDLKIESKKLTLILDGKKIMDRNDLETSNGKYYLNEEYKNCYYPFSNSPGVYLFFNKDKEAIYVGKSEGKVGRRIWSHTGPYKNGEYADLEFKDAEYVIVIPFIEAPFMAPSFESYLLNKYEFKYNKN